MLSGLVRDAPVKSGLGVIVMAVLCVAVILGFAPSTGSAEPPRGSPPAADEWLTRAAEYVRGEVAYAASRTSNAAQRPLPPAETEILLAATAVRYVSNRLSPLRYGFLVGMQGQAAPTSSAICVELGIGICGHHIETALTLLRRLGLRARSVQFYWVGPKGSASHILAEVHAGGAWRLFDVTWATWFTRSAEKPLDIVSYADLEGGNLERFHRQTDVTNPAYVAARLGGLDPFAYLRAWPSKSVLVGMNGTVWLAGQATDTEGERWIPRNAPNFVGRALDHGELTSGTVEVALESNQDPTMGLTFNDATVACTRGEVLVTGDGRAVARSVLRQNSAQDRSFRIEWPEAVQARTFGIRVESPGHAPCYFVFSSISAVSP